MMGILYIIIGFFCAEGIWVTVTGRSSFRKKYNKALYEDIEERAKSLRTTMDRLRDSGGNIHYDGTRDSGLSKRILRALSDGRMRDD